MQSMPRAPKHREASPPQSTFPDPRAELYSIFKTFMSAYNERDEKRLKLEVAKAEMSAEALETLAAGIQRMGPQPTPLFEQLMDVPRDTAKVDLPKPFNDARGSILNIANAPVGSVVLISSKKGTTRAKHWHKSDGHLCFVVRGSIEYFERPLPLTGLGVDPVPVTRAMYFAGEAFFTGPNIEHEMYFPEDTLFITLGRLSRTPEEYEKDLVRLSYSLRELYAAEQDQKSAKRTGS